MRELLGLRRELSWRPRGFSHDGLGARVDSRAILAPARSVESLRKDRKEAKAECLRCHVTGYARPGGFPKEGSVGSHEDLARVGCESCHGSGAEHVKDDGKHLGGIVKLGDKCDSCVILQICGACHDDANDPGFRFNVKRAINAQRHGNARDEAVSGRATRE